MMPAKNTANQSNLTVLVTLLQEGCPILVTLFEWAKKDTVPEYAVKKHMENCCTEVGLPAHVDYGTSSSPAH